MKNDLTPGREAWLRQHIPEFNEMRNKAIAAGVIDPTLPLTEFQADQIKAIATRVRAKLKGGVNDNAEEG